MSKFLIAIALFLVATSATAAPSYGEGSEASLTWVNAPGGDYIQCDPSNPSSPVRCKPDGW